MEAITVAPAAIAGLHLAQTNTKVVFEEGAEVPEHDGMGSLFITERWAAYYDTCHSRKKKKHLQL